jgi:hypothetical protein
MNKLKERLKEVRLFHKIRLKELRNKKYKSPEEFEEYHLLQQKVKEKPKKAKVIILDDNPLSIACYMEEHPEVSFEEDTMVKSNHIEEKKKEKME